MDEMIYLPRHVSLNLAFRFRLGRTGHRDNAFLIVSESSLVILGLFCAGLFIVCLLVLFGFIHFLPVSEKKKIGATQCALSYVWAFVVLSFCCL